MARHSERTVNHELAQALRRLNLSWRDCIAAEQTDVLEDRSRQPNILVQQLDGQPIAIETEFSPASTVDRDARKRLGNVAKQSGTVIEQAIALKLPSDLRGVETDLAEAVASATLRWRVVSWRAGGDDGIAQQPPPRAARIEADIWPSEGWINGGVSDLADTIARLAVSERLVARSLGSLERAIYQTANRVRADALPDAPGLLEALARELHQEDSVQTTRMAMAIIANALIYY